jgi:hypothetical protein
VPVTICPLSLGSTKISNTNASVVQTMYSLLGNKIRCNLGARYAAYVQLLLYKLSKRDTVSMIPVKKEPFKSVFMFKVKKESIVDWIPSMKNESADMDDR